MAGLNHQFFLLSQSVHPYENYEVFINDTRGLELHDDLIHYMYDTLRWIPTINPSRSEPHSGLCLYGPTVIEEAGAVMAHKVFTAWASLFSLGPSLLSLHGVRMFSHNEWLISGKEDFVDTINVQKDELVTKLQQLATYAEQVTVSNGELYILHVGI